ncbi:MAG: hypothetical protein IAE80_25900 [Anaerolinea sp.]|nr:hypothetical protein [Anaerolinea sp.]
MIRQAFILIAALSLIFALLIGAASMIGGGIPTASSEATAVGLNPCQLPCVYGITPGTTDRTNAFAAVDQIALNRSFLTMTRTSFTLPNSVLGLLTFDQQDEQATVSSVGLFSMSTRIDALEIGEFSDLLKRGWLPERVFLTCDVPAEVEMFVTMDNGHVLTRIPLTEIGVNAPVLSFTMYSVNGGADQFMDNNVECLVEKHWIGFASAWRYLQAPALASNDTQ